MNVPEIFQNVDYLKNLDAHLEQTASEAWIQVWKSKTFYLEFNGQVLVRQGYLLNLYSFQSFLDFTPAFINSCRVQVQQGMWVWYFFFTNASCFRCTNSGLNSVTILMDGKMNNIIIRQHQKPWCFSPINLRVQSGYQFLS